MDMSPKYTNELTPELAAVLAGPPFPAEKKAAISEVTRQAVKMQATFLREYPRIAIDGTPGRIATGTGLNR